MKSLSLTQPHLIVVIGIPGSGKSFFAEKFAETFHAPSVSQGELQVLSGGSDAEVKALFDYQLEQLVKTRQSIVVDGFADTKTARLELARMARASGYELLLVWVQIDPATAKARAIKAAKKFLMDYSSSDYDKAVKRFTPPSASEITTVISGKHTYASQAKVVLKKLSAPRAEISTHSAAPIREAKPGRHNITVR